MTEQNTHAKAPKKVETVEENTGQKKPKSIFLPAALIGCIVLVGFVAAAFYL